MRGDDELATQATRVITYGWHGAGCSHAQPGKDCTCGFDAAQADAEATLEAIGQPLPPVDRTSGVCGGSFVLRDSRIPVAHLWKLHTKLGWSVPDIAHEYPHLSSDRIAGAIEFARTRPDARRD